MVGHDRLVGYHHRGRGFPTDLPMVGLISVVTPAFASRGFPTDLPMVGRRIDGRARKRGRGFPTDLPMVGPPHQ